MSDVIICRKGLTITKYWNGKEAILQFDYKGNQLDVPLYIFPESIIRAVVRLTK